MKKKAKGSILTMFLVFFTVLITVGTAIMTLSLTTFKNTKMQAVMENNIYTAESGLDIVHKVILSKIDRAYQTSQKSVEELIISNIDKGITNEEIEEKFKEEYKMYLKNELINKIDLIDSKEYRNVNNDDIFTSLKDKNIIIKRGKVDYGNTITLPIITEYEHEGIKKSIQVTFDIQYPEFKDVVMYRNPIWSNSISTDQNVKFNNKAPVVINGDIYAHRKRAENEGKETGVIFSNESNIEINGDVSTNSSMFFNGINNKNNKVILNGNIYSENFITEGNFMEVSNFHIDVRKGTYLLDDMEINSKGAKLNFEKGIFAVNSGGEGGKVNSSSSLILNGRYNELSIKEKLYISGTSYINDGGVEYQTGESLSIKGNYFLYTNMVSHESLITQEVEALIECEKKCEEECRVEVEKKCSEKCKKRKEENKKRILASITKEELDKLKESSWRVETDYSEFGGFNLLTGVIFLEESSDEEIFKKPLNERDKKRLFELYLKNEKSIPKLISRDNNINIDSETEIIELGATPFTVNGELDIKDNNLQAEENYGTKIKPLKEDTYKNLYLLGNPQLYSRSVSDKNIEKWGGTMFDVCDLYDNNSVEISILDGEKPDNHNGEKNFKESIILFAGNNKVVIESSSGDNSLKKEDGVFRIGIKDPDIKCIILTNKSIEINNLDEMTINGALISQGDIVFNNSGEVTLNYNKKYIESMIAHEYGELSKLLYLDKSMIKKSNNEGTIKEVVIIEGLNTRFEAKDFVKRKDWSVIR